MQSPLTATGRFATDNASKYLQQLCKHFAHKVDVTYDATTADAAMPLGACRMWADDSELRVTVTAPDADGLARAKSVIDVHLERFAFREAFKTMDWT